jgi:hypothetical protein
LLAPPKRLRGQTGILEEGLLFPGRGCVVAVAVVAVEAVEAVEAVVAVVVVVAVKIIGL